MITPLHYIGLSWILFGIGVGTAVVRRHPLVVLLGIGLALQAVSLSLAALTSWFQDWDGEIAFFVIVVVSSVQLVSGLGAVLACKRPWREERPASFHSDL